MIRFNPKDKPLEGWTARHAECTASGYDNMLAIEPVTYRETRAAAYTVEYGIGEDRELCMQITTHNHEQEGGDALVILNVRPHTATVSGNHGGPELRIDGIEGQAAVQWPESSPQDLATEARAWHEAVNAVVELDARDERDGGAMTDAAYSARLALNLTGLAAFLQRTAGAEARPILMHGEHATVLAALRFYQQHGMGDPGNRTDAIHEVATDGGRVISLNADGIDALCERLNVADGDATARWPQQVDAGEVTAAAWDLIAVARALNDGPDSASVDAAINRLSSALYGAAPQPEPDLCVCGKAEADCAASDACTVVPGAGQESA